MSDLRLPLGKTCTKCNEWKLWDDFYRHKQRNDGKTPRCKKCLNTQIAKYQHDNKDKFNQYKRLWRERNPAYNREYRDRHREEMAERDRVYYEANRDRIAAYKQRYYQDNREQEISRTLRWQVNNPDKVRIKRIRRRAREAGAAGDFTEGEWLELCEYYGNRCLSCGEQQLLTVDHVIPISKGGANSIENLQPLCHSCNSSKNTRVIDYR